MRPTAVVKESKLSTGTIKHQPILPPSADGNRQHLVEFMRKLTDNRVVQLSVFESLNHDDLEMLFESISDENEQLRKCAAKFICYLLYDNEKIQQFLIDRQHICSSEGKFLLNELPRHLSADTVVGTYCAKRELLKAIEGIPEGWEEKSGQSPLCWVIDTESKAFRWLSWEEQSKISGFVDPFSCIFGIVRRHKSAASRRLLNKTISTTTTRQEPVPTKPEYLDRLLKRKSIRDK